MDFEKRDISKVNFLGGGKNQNHKVSVMIGLLCCNRVTDKGLKVSMLSKFWVLTPEYLKDNV